MVDTVKFHVPRLTLAREEAQEQVVVRPQVVSMATRGIMEVGAHLMKVLERAPRALRGLVPIVLLQEGVMVAEQVVLLTN
jgi:hypothetical protein